MTANRLADCMKPVIEHLESRQLMSVTISPTFVDSEGHVTLKIRGDSKNDTVVVTDDPTNATVTVAVSGKPTVNIAYPGDEIEVFDIDLKGGNDSLTVTTANDPADPAYINEARSFLLDGDSGNDKIDLTIVGPIVGGSNISVQIDGDSGNDTINAAFDVLSNAKLDVDITAGDGNDIGTVNLANGLTGYAYINYGSSATLAVDLGSGKNSLNVNTNATISYDSVVDIDVKGGNSTGSSFDAVTLDFDATTVEGKLFVDCATLAGDDTVTLAVDGLYVGSQVTYPTYLAPVALFNINGGDGKDTINANAVNTGIYVDPEAFLSFAIRGGNGDDKINLNFTGPVELAFGGQTVINIDGQNNNDTINASILFSDQGTILDNGGTGGGQIDLSIKGGQNTDSVTFTGLDNSIGVFFGPSAFGPLIDGQTGTDKATVNTIGFLTAPIVRNFEQSNVTNL